MNIIHIIKSMKPNGLHYIENFLSEDDEIQLLNLLENTNEWFNVSRNINSRQVIHYGYEYSYLSKSAKPKKITDIPNIYRTTILDKLNDAIPNDVYNDILKNYNFDQLIINRYEPGQGIAMHIDNLNYFDDVILCVTIGSGTTMNFQCNEKGYLHNKYIKPRSAYIMSKRARNNWSHGIDKKTYDIVNDVMIKRNTRYSLTFRKMKA